MPKRSRVEEKAYLRRSRITPHIQQLIRGAPVGEKHNVCSIMRHLEDMMERGQIDQPINAGKINRKDIESVLHSLVGTGDCIVMEKRYVSSDNSSA